jgi:cobalt/nickel transport protein
MTWALRKYRIEIIAVTVLAIFAIIFAIQSGSGRYEYAGTDNAGASLIQSSGYEPWTKPIWTPPGNEVATLLFCLQSAAGALVIGYFFGYNRGRLQSA